MAFKIHPDVAAILAETLTGLVDAGATPGKILIYDGVEPANPTIPVGAQILLAEFTLANPSFAAPTQEVTGAVAAGTLPPAVPAAQNGLATWGRLVDGDGNVIIQGSATTMGGNGQFKLTSTDLVQGVDVAVVELTYTQPRGY